VSLSKTKGRFKKAPIDQVIARVCFNSRGEETIEVEVKVKGYLGRAAAPSGASVGKSEVVAYPQGSPRAAVLQFSKEVDRLKGVDAADPEAVRQALRQLDGGERYGRIGGSIAYAFSLAAIQAGARFNGTFIHKILSDSPCTLPYPLGNVLGGGKHAGRGTPDIQEFLVCPTGAKTILDALAANASVHREVGVELARRDPSFTAGRGDEGAWAPKISDDEALEVMAEQAEKVTATLGIKISLGLDFAASSLWDEKTQRYVYARRGKTRDPQDQLQYVLDLVKRYNLFYVEDPLHEEAFDEFADLTRKLSGCYVTGDDLFVTNTGRLLKASAIGAGNAAILKVNQVGTLADALDFARLASEKGYSIITSHRSGETPGAHIADVAIATGSKMLKSGVVGGERVDKLNRLLRIEEAEHCRMAKLTA